MKRQIYIGFRGQGKTPWLLDNMKAEAELGKELFYLGGKKDHESLQRKLYSLGCNAELKLINKDVNPTNDNCAIYTDGLLYSMWYIWPASVREAAKYDCTWYITLNAEDLCSLNTDATPIEE